MPWYKEVDQYKEELIEIRRYLHMHPELSFKETNTAKYIANYLESINIPVFKNIGGNGLYGILEGALPGPTVLLRADFDALPIQDEKDVPYKSQTPGVMHACGHDGHTAMLLITAKILMNHKEQLKGKVILCHQHAEEVLPGGAQSMINAGILDGVDYVFGTHTSSNLNSNAVSFTAGPAYAFADAFTIDIKGLGGHGAAPHTTHDAIIAASFLITQLQTIVSRSVDPIETGVLTIGEFNSGDAFNVIAETAYLSGTLRTYHPEIKHHMIKRMKEIIEGIEKAYNAQIKLNYTDGYPALINSERETQWLKNLSETIDDIQFIEDGTPSLGGEDFAYFLLERPGCYFNTGVRNEHLKADFPHHHPKFDMDENGLLNGVRVFIHLIEHMDELNKD
ncbi:amidohydrolase [Macrococcoides caseolyticum]|uniref:amidohydrolase n=1 Tax=Macrococcoides caseolyticum TaxID=69966 RepID=UPI001F3D3553|nr:amidohydrolase [Macrococcus caseolyticus]MCE4957885.1 amidohydrolase [Macrococcus caseolyticus]